jgi:Arc/MetJ-type ribon-helix-helix transcriptional regulator
VEPQTQITLRLPAEWLDDADALVGRIAWGAPLTRSDVLRMALRAGLDTLAHEKTPRATKPKAAKTKSRKKTK